MDFQPSPHARTWLGRLQAFTDRWLLPCNAAWHRHAAAGEVPPFLEDLKALASEDGLWNLGLPRLTADEPGTRLDNLDYAPLAEHMGRLLVVMARDDGAAPDDRHAAHSLVLVPIDTPGVQVVRNMAIMQHHSSEGHCELLLSGVRVPAEHLLGSWGQGFTLAQSRLGPGQVHHCMRTIGQCELALELACDRALERRAFGRALAEQANVQEWIADSRIEIEQDRLLVLRTAWALDQPVPPPGLRADIAAIKVVSARLQTRVVHRAMQVFGAMGMGPGTPLAWLWTWGRALRFLDGPDEVHLRTIARAELEQARSRGGASMGCFTTPEQMAAEPRWRQGLRAVRSWVAVRRLPARSACVRRAGRPPRAGTHPAGSSS